MKETDDVRFALCVTYDECTGISTFDIRGFHTHNTIIMLCVRRWTFRKRCVRSGIYIIYTWYYYIRSRVRRVCTRRVKSACQRLLTLGPPISLWLANMAVCVCVRVCVWYSYSGPKAAAAVRLPENYTRLRSHVSTLRVLLRTTGYYHIIGTKYYTRMYL